MKVRNQKKATKLEIPMTPMIDIVFQLLVFFIMTFKIVAPEGDFNIKMPLAAPSEGPPDPELLPPIKIVLRADANGDIAGIQFGEDSITGGWGQLHQKVVDTVGDDPSQRAELEAEFEPAYELNYVHLINAITAVTGERNADGSITRFIEKIKFAEPKEKP